MNITELQLARWIRHQRSRCDDSRRRALLEKIPGWTWEVRDYDAAWEEGFAQLKKYGMPTSMTTLTVTTPTGYKLASWINNQRFRCKDEEKRKRLESIPGWAWNAQDAKFELGFAKLKEHGKIPTKSFILEDGFKLGYWVENQKNFCVDPDRRKRLERIKGWTWYPSNAKARRK